MYNMRVLCWALLSRDPPVRQQSTPEIEAECCVYESQIERFDCCRASKGGCVTRAVRGVVVNSEVSRGGRLVNELE